jgi:hypothetical protein
MPGAIEVVRPWRERNRLGDMGSRAEVVDLHGYTERCLGRQGWAIGYDVALDKYVCNLVEPWADVVSSEQAVIEGPNGAAAAGLSFDGLATRATDAVRRRCRHGRAAGASAAQPRSPPASGC